MSLFVAIMHAAWPGAGREETLARCLSRLQGAAVHVEADTERKGVWPVALACWKAGLESGAEHIAVMNDDALPCLGFPEVAAAALKAKPQDIVCFYANGCTDAELAVSGVRWKRSADAFVGVAGAMPRALVEEFVAFAEDGFLEDRGPLPDDTRLALWAMATGRPILTTLPSLVDHQRPAESLAGNETHDWRRPSVPPWEDAGVMASIDWSGATADVGRVYNANHWRVLVQTNPARWPKGVVERVYTLHRAPQQGK